MKISESGNSITELISQYKINEEKVSSEPEKQAANSVVQEALYPPRQGIFSRQKRLSKNSPMFAKKRSGNCKIR
jgi:hypothetical protein